MKGARELANKIAIEHLGLSLLDAIYWEASPSKFTPFLQLPENYETGQSIPAVAGVQPCTFTLVFPSSLVIVPAESAKMKSSDARKGGSPPSTGELAVAKAANFVGEFAQNLKPSGGFMSQVTAKVAGVANELAQLGVKGARETLRESVSESLDRLKISPFSVDAQETSLRRLDDIHSPVSIGLKAETCRRAGGRVAEKGRKSRPVQGPGLEKVGGLRLQAATSNKKLLACPGKGMSSRRTLFIESFLVFGSSQNVSREAFSV